MAGKADTSWNSSVNGNKSWVEFVEEEEPKMGTSTGSDSSFVSFTGFFRSGYSSTDSGNNLSFSEKQTDNDDDDEKKVTSTGRRKKKQKKEDDVDVWTVRSKKFEIIDKQNSSKTGNEDSEDKDALFDIAIAPIRRFPENVPSEQLASIKSSSVDKRANTTERRTMQCGNSKNVAIDNLLLESKSNRTTGSLTGHSDVFCADSPIKSLKNVPADVLEIMCDTTMFSPIKVNTVESAAVKKRSNDSPDPPSKRNCSVEVKYLGTTSARTKKSNGEEKASVSEPFRSRKRTYSDCCSIAGSTLSSRYNSTKSLRADQSDPDRYETDPEVLVRRQKQIDYGKNTVEYQNYRIAVPLRQRVKSDPKTPPKHLKYSRRTFDGLIKSWRCRLHEYDNSIE